MAKKTTKKALTRKSNREVKINGARLREARLAKDMSQMDLGHASKVSPPDISALENGEGTDLRSSGLYRMAEALGVSMDWLCLRTDQMHLP